MIARVKVTGEIVNVKFKIGHKGEVFIDDYGREFMKCDLDFDSLLDWKKVRAEIVFKLLDKVNREDISHSFFEDKIMKKADSLTKKLMEDIE